VNTFCVGICFVLFPFPGADGQKPLHIDELRFAAEAMSADAISTGYSTATWTPFLSSHWLRWYSFALGPQIGATLYAFQANTLTDDVYTNTYIAEIVSDQSGRYVTFEMQVERPNILVPPMRGGSCATPTECPFNNGHVLLDPSSYTPWTPGGNLLKGKELTFCMWARISQVNHRSTLFSAGTVNGQVSSTGQA
jgi:hypothetical protein